LPISVRSPATSAARSGRVSMSTCS
jgi:hypothetical protein